MKSWSSPAVLFTIAALAVAAPAALAQSDNPSGAVAFESFKVQGSIQFPQGDAKSGSLSLRAQFTPGLGDGIFPDNEDITLVIEPEPSDTNLPVPPVTLSPCPPDAWCPTRTEAGRWATAQYALATSSSSCCSPVRIPRWT